MTKSSSDRFKTQLINGLLSCPVVYINHFHYAYVDDVLGEILSSPLFNLTSDSVLEYDCGQGGVVSFDSKEIDPAFKKYNNIRSVLRILVDYSREEVSEFDEDARPVFPDKRVFLFKGVSTELAGETNLSLIQTFVSKYEKGGYNENTTIVIVSPEPVANLPLALRKVATILEILPPSVGEIRELIMSSSYTISDNPRQQKYLDEMVRTLQGLQMYEVKQTLKTVLTLRNNRIDRSAIRIALDEKKRIVRKSGIIEVIDSAISFDEVGGLKRLRRDLEMKSMIYHNLGEAEKFNIAIPKGILIIGMPGCGKSMIAQAAANLFEVSLLRLDVSRLMGKYVGESESNLRLALATAEAAHPCVLWIDEIEKAFAGSNNSSGDNDMLVMRMMGHFLTWMQERKSPVYIIATANDVMRPEFMRKGRFDEIYFVDFPNKEERAEILRKKIERKFEDSELFDFSQIGNCRKVVERMEGEYGGFSGSEIESVLNMVVEKKFSEYLEKKKSATIGNGCASKIKIEAKDFYDAVDLIKDSVMANQKSKAVDKKEALREKTSIERIIDMKDTYNFTNAGI